MRKFFLLMMAACATLGMMAGDLTPSTRVFLNKQQRNISANSPLKKMSVSPKSVDGKEYVDCFITLDGASVSSLEAKGVKVSGVYDNFVTAQVPVSELENVARVSGVMQVGMARKPRLFTDKAMDLTNSAKVWDGTNNGLPQAYTGKDVVLGIIDDGIEFNHPAFKDASGNTRVKAVYMPNASAANGGSKATVDGTTLTGYQYTTASQIANLTTDDTGETHGTHTSGCAGASKIEFSTGNYYAGMAPEVDLVLCGCGEELTETAILNSAKYIANYAKSVGKPCVISISLGSETGPHDGKSPISLGYQEVAEKYGAVILLAAGNEADVPGNAVKTLSSNSDAMAVIHTPTSYFSRQYGSYYGLVGDCDIWNSTSDALTVTVMVLNSSGTAVYTSSAMSNGTISASTLSSYFTSVSQGGIEIQGGVDANNGRYNILIDAYLGSNKGSYKIAYIIKGKSGNVINVYTDASYSQLASSGSISGYTLSAGKYEGTMCDDMCSPKVIGVGAYCSRTTMPTNYGSSTSNVSSYYDTTTLNDIASFSSYGVDCNGVQQPYITAPGHTVVSSINRYDSSDIASAYSSYRKSYSGTYEYWGWMSGTSMATPVAAGVVALYLQADPTLDVDGVKEVIANSAITDSYTNGTNKAKFGHGKINALGGIEYILSQSTDPTITVTPQSLEFNGYVGDTYTNTVTVKGANLTGNITIAKSGSSDFTVSPTTITAAQAESGVTVTVTYKPTAAGNATGTLTLSSNGAESKTVTLTGAAQAKVPTINVTPTNLTLNASLGATVNGTVNVTGQFLNGNVNVALTDANGVFRVEPTTISASSISENTPVAVKVYFSSENEGTYTGTLTFTSDGAEQKTVTVTATANDGGTASDSYLNIAKYATIDEAGASVTGMQSIYKYTEYPSDGCAWLTLSSRGALQAAANQKWYSMSSVTQYSNTWTATDIFPGATAYFGSSSGYSVYGSGNQDFYVTNCSQVKALVKDGSSSKATMRIYECTVGADGSVTAGTTAVDTQTGGESGTAVITSSALDAAKVYLVRLTGGSSYPDFLEVGFQTPIQSIDTPVATDATAVGGDRFTAHWTACENALSYTLRVMPKPEITTEMILSEDFSKFTNADGNTNLGNSLDNYMQNAGWTGTYVYERAGGLQIGSNSYTGTLTSPALDLSKSGGKVTVKFKAYCPSSSNAPSTFYVSMNGSTTDAQTLSIAYATSGQEYTVVLDCNATTGQTVYFRTAARKYRVVMTDLEIYSGDITAAAAPALMASETRTDDQIIVTGITDTEYTVTGLEPETTYIYDVKAVYADVESNWSNQIEVTTTADAGTTLADVLNTGVNGQEYTISNDLAVVDIADYANYAFLTDGEDNWIRVTATDDIFAAFVNNKVIKGGTLKATLSGIELNPMLTATATPEAGDATIDYTINVFDLTDGFAPKVNQVIDVKGYWNADDNALRAYSQYPQGKSMTLDYTWGAASNTLQDGKNYQIRCAMNIKEAWKNLTQGATLLDYDFDFQNYIGYALRLPSTSTGIEMIGIDANSIVDVFNMQGMMLKHAVKAADATRGLTPGFYIIGNKKVLVK